MYVHLQWASAAAAFSFPLAVLTSMCHPEAMHPLMSVFLTAKQLKAAGSLAACPGTCQRLAMRCYLTIYRQTACSLQLLGGQPLMGTCMILPLCHAHPSVWQHSGAPAGCRQSGCMLWGRKLLQCMLLPAAQLCSQTAGSLLLLHGDDGLEGLHGFKFDAAHRSQLSVIMEQVRAAARQLSEACNDLVTPCSIQSDCLRPSAAPGGCHAGGGAGTPMRLLKCGRILEQLKAAASLAACSGGC